MSARRRRSSVVLHSREMADSSRPDYGEGRAGEEGHVARRGAQASRPTRGEACVVPVRLGRMTNVLSLDCMSLG